MADDNIPELPDNTPIEPKVALRHSLSAFVESPFFWGGVGVVLTILAFVFWGFLFVIAWFFFAVAVIKTPIFVGQSRNTRIAGNVGVCVFLGFGLFLIWWKLPPPQSAVSREDISKALKEALATPTPQANLSSPQFTPTPPSPASQSARNELRADSLKPIRDVAFNLKLNRTYSIQELGHFRILIEIAGNDDIPDFFFGCQDAYLANTVNTSVDPTVKQFGIRYTARYRASKKNGTYVAIPVYTRPPKYTTVLSASQFVDTLGFSLDLYNQIPSYKTLEDLNRKVLHVYITQNLVGKLGEFSFTVNNYELISEKATALALTSDKPTTNWFMPLSAEERAIQWNGMYLRPTEEIAKQVPGAVVVWTLDFGIINPKKLPEPESKVENPYDQ
jgi:hypothetical protein